MPFKDSHHILNIFYGPKKNMLHIVLMHVWSHSSNLRTSVLISNSCTRDIASSGMFPTSAALGMAVTWHHSSAWLISASVIFPLNQKDPNISQRCIMCILFILFLIHSYCDPGCTDSWLSIVRSLCPKHGGGIAWKQGTLLNRVWVCSVPACTSKPADDSACCIAAWWRESEPGKKWILRTDGSLMIIFISDQLGIGSKKWMTKGSWRYANSNLQFLSPHVPSIV